ncbi:BC1881 family protein [Bacillus mycoides]|nr:BC1881 family protein [Bacillus mycoides]KMQ12766.1 phage protein [Bacillus mycoides]QWH97201.1 BC1881 family protein [Bacillus mycoides]
MKNISTKNLSEELETREGIITVQVSPHEKIEVAGITVEGPAMILINKD